MKYKRQVRFSYSCYCSCSMNGRTDSIAFLPVLELRPVHSGKKVQKKSPWKPFPMLTWVRTPDSLSLWANRSPSSLMMSNSLTTTIVGGRPLRSGAISGHNLGSVNLSLISLCNSASYDEVHLSTFAFAFAPLPSLTSSGLGLRNFSGRSRVSRRSENCLRSFGGTWRLLSMMAAYSLTLLRSGEIKSIPIIQ